MLTSLLPRQLNITACYPKYHGYSISSSLQQLVENYRCGECGLAAGEWKYSSIAGLGALNLTSRVRVFSVVRDPLMWFLSKVGHDLRSAFVALLLTGTTASMMRSTRRRTGAARRTRTAR